MAKSKITTSDAPGIGGLTLEQIIGKGLENYNRQEFESSVLFLEYAAQHNHGASLRRLGYLYEHGKGGLVKNETKAKELHLKALPLLKVAVASGDPDAQANLGRLYDGAIGININKEEAARLYGLAAEQSNAYAQCALANMYYSGIGVTLDKVAAAYWYIKSAEQNDEKARKNLKQLAQNDPQVVLEARARIESEQKKASESQKTIITKTSPLTNRAVLRRRSSTFADLPLDQIISKSIEYYNVENYSAALPYLKHAVEFDHGPSLRRLGYINEHGKADIPQNQDEARRLYIRAAELCQKAAEEGDLDSQFSIGMMYKEGVGVRQDYGQALLWCNKAAEGGLAMAQYGLGMMYKHGTGVILDYDLSLEWCRKAAEGGLAIAQFELGFMYQNGLCVNKDFALARGWYQRAAEQSLAEAQFRLGFIYQNGLGVVKNNKQAVKWYLESAEFGLASSQNSLGYMYENGLGVNRNHAQALAWYRKAADQGWADAQCHLGYMYQNGMGGTARDYRRALSWYHKAADQNYAYAQYKIGNMYENGLGVPQDCVQAVIWYRKAADQNLAQAQHCLGEIYEFGREEVKSYAQVVKENPKSPTRLGQANSAQIPNTHPGENRMAIVPDRVLSAFWYLKAAEQNYDIAITKLRVFSPKNPEAIKEAKARIEQEEINSFEDTELGVIEASAINPQSTLHLSTSLDSTSLIISVEPDQEVEIVHDDIVPLDAAAGTAGTINAEDSIDIVDAMEVGDYEEEVITPQVSETMDNASVVGTPITREEFFKYTASLVSRSEVSAAILTNAEQKARIQEMDYIEMDPRLVEYYQVLNSTLYSIFMTCSALSTDMIDSSSATIHHNRAKKVASYTVKAINYLASSIPLIGHISTVVKVVVDNAIELDSENRVNRLLRLIPDHSNAVEVVSKISRIITIAMEDRIKSLQSTPNHPLISFLKAQKDKIIVNNVNTIYKAVATAHAACIIKEAMNGSLSYEIFNSDYIVLLIDSEIDLAFLRSKLTEIYAQTSDSIEFIDIEPPHGFASSLSQITKDEYVKLNRKISEIRLRSENAADSDELSRLKAELLTTSEDLKKVREKLDSLEQAKSPTHSSPIQSSGGLKYNTGFDNDNADGRKALAKLNMLARAREDHEALLADITPKLDLLYGDAISDMALDKVNRKKFKAHIFDFQQAVRIIKKIADNHFGIGCHTLSKQHIAIALQGPSTLKPIKVSGAVIWKILKDSLLADTISIGTLCAEFGLTLTNLNKQEAGAVDSEEQIRRQLLQPRESDSVDPADSNVYMAAGAASVTMSKERIKLLSIPAAPRFGLIKGSAENKLRPKQDLAHTREYRRAFHKLEFDFLLAVGILNQITNETYRQNNNPYSPKLTLKEKIRFNKSICISTALGAVDDINPDTTSGTKILAFLDNHPELWEVLTIEGLLEKFGVDLCRASKSEQSSDNVSKEPDSDDEINSSNLRRAEKRYFHDKTMPSNRLAISTTSTAPISLVNANGTTITLIPERSHTHQHKANIVQLIAQINNDTVTSGTVICLERKQHGNNLGMRDVIKLAKTLESSDNIPLQLPASVINSPIYADALLYNAARAKGIEVIGIEGKGLAQDQSSLYYNDAREEYMASQIKQIASKGNNVVFVVGSAHIGGIITRLSDVQISLDIANPAKTLNTVNKECNSSWIAAINKERDHCRDSSIETNSLRR